MSLLSTCKGLTCVNEEELVRRAVRFAAAIRVKHCSDPIKAILIILSETEQVERDTSFRLHRLLQCTKEADYSHLTARASIWAVNKALCRNRIGLKKENADDEIISEIVANGYSLRQQADFTG